MTNLLIAFSILGTVAFMISMFILKRNGKHLLF